MMIAMVIGLSAVGWQAPEASGNLLSRLISPRVMERETAARELEALGDAGRKLLESATESTNLELRAEAAVLLDRIEGRKLSEPSKVRLDLDGGTLMDATAAITRQTGVTFQLDPETDPRWRVPVLTIHEDLTLWDTIDQLSSRGQVGLDPLVRRSRITMQRDGRRMLQVPDLTFRTDLGPPPPTSNSGAFRTILLGLRLYQVRNFAQKPGMAGPLPPENSFSVQLQVRAEPRLTLASLDEPILTQALDDRGQSLMSDTPQVANVPPQRGFGDDMTRAGTHTLALRYPEKPGRTISVLSGSLKGLVVARRGEPMIVPLDRKQTPFTASGITLTIHDVRPAQNGQLAEVKLTLDGPESAANPIQTNGRFDPRTGLQPPPSAKGYLDFYDDQGKLCQRFDLGQMTMGVSMGKPFTLMVQPAPGAKFPTEARFHPAIWSLVEIPFEFHDVPMP